MEECLDNFFKNSLLYIEQYYIPSLISPKSYLNLVGMYYFQFMDEEMEIQELSNFLKVTLLKHEV